MDTIKNYALIILSILCLVFGYLAFQKQKIVTKTQTITEVKEVVKYVASNSKVVGATSATINPNGSTSIAGANLTITNTTTVTEKENTKTIDKELSKYATYGIYAGPEVFIADKPYLGIGGTLLLDTWIIDGAYYPARIEYRAGIKTALIKW